MAKDVERALIGRDRELRRALGETTQWRSSLI